MRVLASRHFPGPAWERLEDVVVEWPVAEERPGVEALALVAAKVGEELLDLFPDLRLVANYGVGYDGIDVEACARRGVAVTNTPEALGIATADLTVALVLAVRRRIVEGDRFVREGPWAAGWHVGQLMGERPLAALFRESLLIVGWVAMWRPLEIFLYDWWPILGECRLYARLSESTVRIVQGGSGQSKAG